jgi:O-antigen/teichoic acid export membrane protein
VQIINLGVIPLVIFLFSENIEQLYLYMGLLMSLFSLILLTQIFLSQKFELQRVKDFIPKVFIYGLQRLPADFGIASLIALPAIFAAHSEGFVTAGYVAFSVSLLSLSGQVVAPIGLVMLPKISHLLGEKNFTMIQHYVKKLLLISLFVALFGTVIYQLFAKEILSLYLGDNITPELVNISKNILWGALFYPLYVTLRSVVDGYYDRAYNTISIFAALILFVVLFFAGTKVHFALNAALALLALMTLYFIKPLLMRVKS